MTRPHGGTSWRRGGWIALMAGILGLFPAVGEAAPTAYDVDTALARLGPRPDGSPSQVQAQELLLTAMRQAGLRDVHASLAGAPGKPPQTALEGVLPGATDQEVILSGHYDTVTKSPGADDDGSGCAVAIAAAADLARTPLRHTVRVVLFNGEEKGLLGSRAWVEALDATRREQIFADLNLEMLGWTGSPGPTLHALPVRRRAGHEMGGFRPAGAVLLPPGWLVHAVLRSGDAVGWPLTMADPRFPLLMQLVQRSVRVRFGADSDAFQAADIPAVTLSDSSFLSLDPTYHKATDVAARLDPHRMEQWTTAVAATVRRLDRLTGAPLSEDQYLVLNGSVWLRQPLWTLGAVLWGALVFRGIPGRWRGASAEERMRQRRAFMPGYGFRLLLLVVLFAAPLFSVLLFPAAVLALVPPRRGWLRLMWAILGLLPLAAYVLALIGGVFAGVVSLRGGFLENPLVLLLLVAGFVAYAVLLASKTPPPASSAAVASPGAPGS
jgi:hypothetical protein